VYFFFSFSSPILDNCQSGCLRSQGNENKIKLGLVITNQSRDGAVVRALASHQCGLGLSLGPRVICGLSMLLVLVLAPRGFSPGIPVFPSPQKPTFLNSNSIQIQWTLIR